MSHESRAVTFALVAGGGPEADRDVIVGRDGHIKADRPTLGQPALAPTNQRRSQAATTMLMANRQPIEAAPPPVPHSYQRADYFALTIRDHERVRIKRQETTELLDAVAHSQGQTRRRPQRQHGVEILHAATSGAPAHHDPDS